MDDMPKTVSFSAGLHYHRRDMIKPLAFFAMLPLVGALASDSGFQRLGDFVAPEPIEAGGAEIVASDMATWRRADFEAFRLRGAPGVIAIHFASYAVQRAFFTRIAFFIDTDVSGGRIEPWAFYDDKHVYNAHDYRAKDIVSFFQALDEQGVEPAGREAEMLELAIAYGLVTVDGGSLLEGEGAIISVAQESPTEYRRKLFTHEAAHGLFHTNESLREEVYGIVASFDEGARLFWELFLANKGRLDGRAGLPGYDVRNEYLFVNEIFAHVLHPATNSIDDLDAYYLSTYLPLMRKLLPEHAAFLQAIAKERKGMFRELHARFVDAIERHCGIAGGKLL
jgi:hypothetical protein